MHRFHVLLMHFFRAYGALLYANLGDNVTLPCFHASGGRNLCWYKQVAGEPPQIISYFYTSSPNSKQFFNQFKEDKRFSLHTGPGFYHLNISNVQDSDSAMYFCGETSVTFTKFKNGTFLVLKGCSCTSSLQQPASDSVQPGGSVTLNCTLHNGTSDGEHSVYWFKKDPHLGVMYAHTHGSGQCVRGESGAPAWSCVYSLSKKFVSLSDAGTYYCAVASCGEILFGKGTKLNVEEEQYDPLPVWLWVVVAALLVSLVVNISLICILCKMAKSTYLQPAGSHPQSAPEYTADAQNEEAEALQYVALDFKKKQSKSRRQKTTETEALYAAVRRSGLE